jgi:hypothetical protein
MKKLFKLIVDGFKAVDAFLTALDFLALLFVVSAVVSLPIYVLLKFVGIEFPILIVLVFILALVLIGYYGIFKNRKKPNTES